MMHPCSSLPHGVSILPPSLSLLTPRKGMGHMLAKLSQEQPMQHFLLLPCVINLQEALHPLASHPHPLSSLCILLMILQLGISPIRATILPKNIFIFAFHGTLKCNLLHGPCLKPQPHMWCMTHKWCMRLIRVSPFLDQIKVAQWSKSILL